MQKKITFKSKNQCVLCGCCMWQRRFCCELYNNYSTVSHFNCFGNKAKLDGDCCRCFCLRNQASNFNFFPQIIIVFSSLSELCQILYSYQYFYQTIFEIHIAKQKFSFKIFQASLPKAIYWECIFLISAVMYFSIRFCLQLDFWHCL